MKGRDEKEETGMEGGRWRERGAKNDNIPKGSLETRRVEEGR